MRGKRSQAIQREHRLTRDIDADTMRQRAFYDRRGTIAFFIRQGEDSFEIQHSVCGRCDQYDIIHNNAVIETVRLGKILETILWLNSKPNRP